MGGEAENSKLVIKLVCLSGDQPPSRSPPKSHLIKAKDAATTQEIPRDLGMLWGSGTRAKDQILEQNVFLVLLSFRKLQEF